MDFRKFDEKINEILCRMSIKEKIGQLCQMAYNGKNYESIENAIKERRIGSIILATSAQAGNDEQIRSNVETVNKLQSLAMENGGIPIIIGRDVIHGHRVVYPVPLAMAASFDPELVKKCYGNIAGEAAFDGIHWSFAPMADLSRDPRWGRSIEGPGEDPYLGAKMTRAAIEGFQGEDYTHPQSIAACVKHFIGYGASEGGRDYNSTEIGEPTLRNFYLKAFDEAVKAGVATVMSSFNFLSGVSLSVDKHLLKEVLKGELGFDGFVVSDWASVKKPFEPGGALESEKQCAELCLNAGLDMEMVTTCYLNNAEELINEGKISVETLDDAVRRILRVKMSFGLFENHQAPTDKVDYEAHIKDAVKVSEESIVLLKNDGVLPLKREESVAVVGPMLHQKANLLGGWTLDYDLAYVRSYKEVLEQDYSDVNAVFNDTELFDSMLVAARKADKVVVLLGESRCMTGENRAVSSVDVPFEQAELVKRIKRLGKKVIAVLTFGRVVATEEIEPYCDAIMYAWHSGTGTAPAVINTLFGENIPSGALPMTMLRHTGQVPLYYNIIRSGSGIGACYYDRDDWMHGYEDSLKTPMYPFGYGISYTTFEYSEPKIVESASYDDIKNGKTFKISVDIKNTGGYDAYEIVQCYVSDIYAQIARPHKELKGFVKELIKVGETKTVTFELGLEALGYYNSENKFTVDKGKFNIYIGKGAFTENKTEFILE